MKISMLRKEYSAKILEINEMNPSPIEQFKFWLNEAIQAEVNEPNAMHLASINKENRPSGRVVLLKGADEGFVFFTNYNSQKGKELIHFPYAALTFFWPEVERQVRIEGEVEKTSAQESDEYFLTRPVESQIGAWSSPQSQEIPDRAFLEKLKKETEEKFELKPISRPENWGGFRLIPDKVEFWQGRPGRLHDRIRYSLDKEGNWKMTRLAP